jgi:hypothetical protein
VRLLSVVEIRTGYGFYNLGLTRREKNHAFKEFSGSLRYSTESPTMSIFFYITLVSAPWKKD